jgi:hypothetical protein
MKPVIFWIDYYIDYFTLIDFKGRMYGGEEKCLENFSWKT